MKKNSRLKNTIQILNGKLRHILTRACCTLFVWPGTMESKWKKIYINGDDCFTAMFKKLFVREFFGSYGTDSFFSVLYLRECVNFSRLVESPTCLSSSKRNKKEYCEQDQYFSFFKTFVYEATIYVRTRSF
jgi:hypothetical protein